jgi:hypothetical protein
VGVLSDLLALLLVLLVSFWGKVLNGWLRFWGDGFLKVLWADGLLGWRVRFVGELIKVLIEIEEDDLD